MHLHELLAQIAANPCVRAREARHAQSVEDVMARLREDGRLDMSAVKVDYLVGDGVTVVHLSKDAEGGLCISIDTDGDEDELTLRASDDHQDCTSKWGFGLEHAVGKHIDSVVDAEASSIVGRVLDGEDSESMAACGWTKGTAEEFAEFWLGGHAGDLLRGQHPYAKELRAAVEEKLRAAYDPSFYDADDEAAEA